MDKKIVSLLAVCFFAIQPVLSQDSPPPAREQVTSGSNNSSEPLVIDFATLAGGQLSVSGDYTNNGTIYAISTNKNVSTALISVQNLVNNGILTSVLPSGGLPGFSNAIGSLNLVVSAQTILNTGTISSSGSLTAIATGAVTNTAGAQFFAQNNLNIITPILSNAGTIAAIQGTANLAVNSIVNQGSIQSLTSNLNIAALNSGLLSILNTNGTLSAANSLTAETVKAASSANITESLRAVCQSLAGSSSATNQIGGEHSELKIEGGTLSANTLLLQSEGKLNVAVDRLDGNTRAKADGFARLIATGGSITLGELCVSGDPVIYSSDDLFLNGANLTFSGQPLLIASGKSIIQTNLGLPVIIDTSTSSPSQNGGPVTILAGVDYNADSGSVSGASTTGGAIYLAAASINSSSSMAMGGAILAAAFAGTEAGGGVDIRQRAGAPFAIDSRGATGGGDVSLIGQAAPSPPVAPFPFTGGRVQVSGRITSDSTAGSAGSVTVVASTPEIQGSLMFRDGLRISGAITPTRGGAGEVLATPGSIATISLVSSVGTSGGRIEVAADKVNVGTFGEAMRASSSISLTAASDMVFFSNGAAGERIEAGTYAVSEPDPLASAVRSLLVAGTDIMSPGSISLKASKVSGSIPLLVSNGGDVRIQAIGNIRSDSTIRAVARGGNIISESTNGSINEGVFLNLAARATAGGQTKGGGIGLFAGTTAGTLVEAALLNRNTVLPPSDPANLLLDGSPATSTRALIDPALAFGVAELQLSTDSDAWANIALTGAPDAVDVDFHTLGSFVPSTYQVNNGVLLISAVGASAIVAAGGITTVAPGTSVPLQEPTVPGGTGPGPGIASTGSASQPPARFAVPNQVAAPGGGVTVNLAPELVLSNSVLATDITPVAPFVLNSQSALFRRENASSRVASAAEQTPFAAYSTAARGEESAAPSTLDEESGGAPLSHLVTEGLFRDPSGFYYNPDQLKQSLRDSATRYLLDVLTFGPPLGQSDATSASQDTQTGVATRYVVDTNSQRNKIDELQGKVALAEAKLDRIDALLTATNQQSLIDKDLNSIKRLYADQLEQVRTIQNYQIEILEVSKSQAAAQKPEIDRTVSTLMVNRSDIIKQYAEISYVLATLPPNADLPGAEGPRRADLQNALLQLENAFVEITRNIEETKAARRKIDEYIQQLSDNQDLLKNSNRQLLARNSQLDQQFEVERRLQELVAQEQSAANNLQHAEAALESAGSPATEFAQLTTLQVMTARNNAAMQFDTAQMARLQFQLANADVAAKAALQQELSALGVHRESLAEANRSIADQKQELIAAVNQRYHRQIVSDITSQSGVQPQFDGPGIEETLEELDRLQSYFQTSVIDPAVERSEQAVNRLQSEHVEEARTNNHGEGPTDKVVIKERLVPDLSVAVKGLVDVSALDVAKKEQKIGYYTSLVTRYQTEARLLTESIGSVVAGAVAANSTELASTRDTKDRFVAEQNARLESSLNQLDAALHSGDPTAEQSLAIARAFVTLRDEYRALAANLSQQNADKLATLQALLPLDGLTPQLSESQAAHGDFIASHTQEVDARISDLASYDPGADSVLTGQIRQIEQKVAAASSKAQSAQAQLSSLTTRQLSDRSLADAQQTIEEGSRYLREVLFSDQTQYRNISGLFEVGAPPGDRQAAFIGTPVPVTYYERVEVRPARTEVIVNTGGRSEKSFLDGGAISVRYRDTVWYVTYPEEYVDVPYEVVETKLEYQDTVYHLDSFFDSLQSALRTSIDGMPGNVVARTLSSLEGAALAPKSIVAYVPPIDQSKLNAYKSVTSSLGLADIGRKLDGGSTAEQQALIDQIDQLSFAVQNGGLAGRLQSNLLQLSQVKDALQALTLNGRTDYAMSSGDQILLRVLQILSDPRLGPLALVNETGISVDQAYALKQSYDLQSGRIDAVTDLQQRLQQAVLRLNAPGISDLEALQVLSDSFHISLDANALLNPGSNQLQLQRLANSGDLGTYLLALGDFSIGSASGFGGSPFEGLAVNGLQNQLSQRLELDSSLRLYSASHLAGLLTAYQSVGDHTMQGVSSDLLQQFAAGRISLRDALGGDEAESRILSLLSGLDAARGQVKLRADERSGTLSKDFGLFAMLGRGAENSLGELGVGLFGSLGFTTATREFLKTDEGLAQSRQIIEQRGDEKLRLIYARLTDALNASDQTESSELLETAFRLIRDYNGTVVDLNNNLSVRSQVQAAYTGMETNLGQQVGSNIVTSVLTLPLANLNFARALAYESRLANFLGQTSSPLLNTALITLDNAALAGAINAAGNSVLRGLDEGFRVANGSQSLLAAAGSLFNGAVTDSVSGSLLFLSNNIIPSLSPTLTSRIGTGASLFYELGKAGLENVAQAYVETPVLGLIGAFQNQLIYFNTNSPYFNLSSAKFAADFSSVLRNQDYGSFDFLASNFVQGLVFSAAGKLTSGAFGNIDAFARRLAEPARPMSIDLTNPGVLRGPELTGGIVEPRRLSDGSLGTAPGAVTRSQLELLLGARVVETATNLSAEARVALTQAQNIRDAALGRLGMGGVDGASLRISDLEAQLGDLPLNRLAELQATRDQNRQKVEQLSAEISALPPNASEFLKGLKERNLRLAETRLNDAEGKLSGYSELMAELQQLRQDVAAADALTVLQKQLDDFARKIGIEPVELILGSQGRASYVSGSNTVRIQEDFLRNSSLFDVFDTLANHELVHKAQDVLKVKLAIETYARDMGIPVENVVLADAARVYGDLTESLVHGTRITLTPELFGEAQRGLNRSGPLSAAERTMALELAAADQIYLTYHDAQSVAILNELQLARELLLRSVDAQTITAVQAVIQVMDSSRLSNGSSVYGSSLSEATNLLSDGNLAGAHELLANAIHDRVDKLVDLYEGNLLERQAFGLPALVGGASVQGTEGVNTGTHDTQNGVARFSTELSPFLMSLLREADAPQSQHSPDFLRMSPIELSRAITSNPAMLGQLVTAVDSAIQAKSQPLESALLEGASRTTMVMGIGEVHGQTGAEARELRMLLTAKAPDFASNGFKTLALEIEVADQGALDVFNDRVSAKQPITSADVQAVSQQLSRYESLAVKEYVDMLRTFAEAGIRLQAVDDHSANSGRDVAMANNIQQVLSSPASAGKVLLLVGSQHLSGGTGSGAPRAAEVMRSMFIDVSTFAMVSPLSFDQGRQNAVMVDTSSVPLLSLVGEDFGGGLFGAGVQPASRFDHLILMPGAQ